MQVLAFRGLVLYWRFVLQCVIYRNMKYLIPFSKHPHRNLPAASSNKRTEANFVLAFGRIYCQEFTDERSNTNQDRSLEMARELYIPSLGIADIVSVFVNTRKTTLHAFEMKIKDWRKALAQAYRYRYYADAVFVVLPPNEAVKAKQSLPTFRAINVGLWAFDKEECTIEKIYTPKKDKPLSSSANNKALALLAQQLKSLHVS